MPSQLEGPSSGDQPVWGSLYRSRADQVSQSRPIFTGDIFAETDLDSAEGGGQGTVIILQHPCALRVDGVNLAARLLVARVKIHRLVPLPFWKTGNFRKMPLPQLLPSKIEDHYAADFVEPAVIKSSELNPTKRLACLSQVGVNLLLQRWVHHNSRVIVPSHTYQMVTSGPFEEAELTEEWCEERALDGADPATTLKDAHDWIRADAAEGISRQKLLEDPQRRSGVRLEMRAHLRQKGA